MSSAVTEKTINTEIASWIERHWSKDQGLQALRNESLSLFQQTGLPVNKAEEYKYTPVTRLLEKNFNFAIDNGAPQSIGKALYEIPGLDAHIIVFVNGVYAADLSSVGKDSFTVLTLKEAVVKHSDKVSSHLGKIADLKSDPFVTWNTASWMDGVFIHVPKNTIIEKPIVLYHVHDTRAGQVLSFNRCLILVETSAQVSVIEKFDSIGDANHFSSLVTEAVVADNAGLDLYEIQNDGGARFHHHHVQINQGNASRVNTYTFCLNGKLLRNNLNLALDGEGIESHMYGLYALTGDTLADNHTVVDHKKPNSFSNELYKGILDESSKGVFNGKIYVRPKAQKTNAFQANRNILLTDKAGVNTKPQLEIWADDVKCSHGCTTGQLDEEAMFYLQARGINKETARAMMLYAFAGELIEQIKHPVIKEYLDQLISERLHKNF